MPWSTDLAINIGPTHATDFLIIKRLDILLHVHSREHFVFQKKKKKDLFATGSHPLPGRNFCAGQVDGQVERRGKDLSRFCFNGAAKDGLGPAQSAFRTSSLERLRPRNC